MSSVNKSILLVDDDQEIRELLETYLTRAGFQVRA
ncbi:DNA-binding response regulator, partial [Pseudomonas sp. HMWF007]